MKKKIIISIVIVVILIAIAGGFFYWWQGQKTKEIREQKVEEPPEEPEEKVIESFGDIIVKETPKGKIVENKKESISMKVPEGWEVNTHTSEDVIFEIRKFGPNQILDTELQDGMILSLYIFDNSEGLNIKDWIEIRKEEVPEEIKKDIEEGIEVNIIEVGEDLTFEEIGNKIIARTISKIPITTDEYNNPIFLEDAERISISFASGSQIFSFECQVAGPNYKDYSRECEEIMKDKIQNEF